MTTISPMLQSMLNGGAQSAPVANMPYPQQPAPQMAQAPDTFTPSTDASMLAPNPLEGQAIQVPSEGAQAAPEAAEKPKKNWKKIALIGAAIAAAAAAIYAFVRKPGKAQEAVQTTMEAFKAEGGTFQKGVATLADGAKYEGRILGTTKGGAEYALEYVNGLMKKSVIGADESALFKTFTRGEDGKITSIVRKVGEQVQTLVRNPEAGAGAKGVKAFIEKATEATT